MILKFFFFVLIVILSVVSVTDGTRTAREDKQSSSPVVNQSDTTKIRDDRMSDQNKYRQSNLALAKEFESIHERFNSLIYYMIHGIYDPQTFYGMEENLSEHLFCMSSLVSSLGVHRERIEKMLAPYHAMHHSILESAALMDVYNPASGPPHRIIYKTIQLKMRLLVFLISSVAPVSKKNKNLAQIEVLDRALASWKRAFDGMVNLSVTLHICFYTQYTEAKKIIKAVREQNSQVSDIVAEEEVST